MAVRRNRKKEEKANLPEEQKSSPSPLESVDSPAKGGQDSGNSSPADEKSDSKRYPFESAKTKENPPVFDLTINGLIEKVKPVFGQVIKRDTSGSNDWVKRNISSDISEAQGHSDVALSHKSFSFLTLLKFLIGFALFGFGFSKLGKIFGIDIEVPEGLMDFLKTINTPWSYVKPGSCRIKVNSSNVDRLTRYVDDVELFRSLKTTKLVFMDSSGDSANFGMLQIKYRPKFLHRQKWMWLIDCNEVDDILYLHCVDSEGDSWTFTPKLYITSDN